MSAPMDVLRRAVDYAEGGEAFQHHETEEARRALEAVAELIEADKRVDLTPLDHLPDDYPCVITVFAGDLRRRNAALARAGAA